MKPAKKSTHPAKDKLDAVGMEEICARTADCIPMRTIAADIGVSWATLAAYINATPERIEQYARAREAQADKFAEDIIEIADEEVTMVKRSKHQPDHSDENADVEVEVVFDPTAVARNRLRVDARKWLAGKMAPKRYGDKTEAEVTHKGGFTVTWANPEES